MNNPNPLIPQGSLSKHSRGNPNVRIAVFTIVAIHAVFFGGLLIQGCKRDYDTPQPEPEPTNNISSYLPPLNPDYYNDFRELPAPATVAGSPLGNSRTEPLAPPPGFQRSPTNIGGGLERAAETSAPPSLVSPPPVREREVPVVRAPEPVSPPPPKPAQTREHTIVRGDTFTTIGEAYGVNAAAIANANPGVDPRRLQVGKKLTIPAASTGGSAEASRQAISPGKEVEGNGRIHVVQRGETLDSIARKHGITVAALKSVNNKRSDLIHPDERLRIPDGNGASRTGR